MYVGMEAREGNVAARRYVEVHQSLSPQERISHRPEQICDLANVSAADLIAWVSRQVWQEGSAKAAMCMSFNRDKVLEKFASYAIESPDNYKHGELFMKASGLLPQQTSRGPAMPPVNFFNMPVASSSSVAGAKSESSPVHASGLRDMDSEIVELAKIMQTGDVEKYGVPGEPDENDDDEGDQDDED
jgi:hypothetical protein